MRKIEIRFRVVDAKESTMYRANIKNPMEYASNIVSKIVTTVESISQNKDIVTINGLTDRPWLEIVANMTDGVFLWMLDYWHLDDEVSSTENKDIAVSIDDWIKKLSLIDSIDGIDQDILTAVITEMQETLARLTK